MRLVARENALRFAEAVKSRPALKEVVKEIRHYADMGFQDYLYYPEPFYEQLSKLDQLHTLIMRPDTNSNRQETWLECWESFFDEINGDPDGRNWDSAMLDMRISMDLDKFPGRFSREPLGTGVCPWEEDPSCLASDLPERTSFCGDHLENSLPALRTCESSSAIIILSPTFLNMKRPCWRLFNPRLPI